MRSILFESQHKLSIKLGNNCSTDHTLHVTFLLNEDYCCVKEKENTLLDAFYTIQFCNYFHCHVCIFWQIWRIWILSIIWYLFLYIEYGNFDKIQFQSWPEYVWWSYVEWFRKISVQFIIYPVITQYIWLCKLNTSLWFILVASSWKTFTVLFYGYYYGFIS